MSEQAEDGATVSAPTTETRLVAAAERLFAQQGVGAVSLRSVMNEAGANVASVHYHFGSKAALLDAVVRSRLDEVTAIRADLLDELTGAEQVTPRDLARALIGPVATIAESGGRHWVKLIGRLLGSNDPGLTALTSTFLDRNARLVELLQRQHPAATRATLDFRLSQAMTLALHVLGDAEHVRSLLTGGGPAWTVDDVTAQLLDVVTAILAGPPDVPA